MKTREPGGIHPSTPFELRKGLVQVDYDTVPLPEWFKEPGEEYGYRPWQHTPLRPYDDPVRAHQQELYKAFERLATEPIPPGLDARIAHLVYVDFMSNNSQRQVESQANYEGWRLDHPEEYDALKANPEMKWLLAEAKDGHANPASLLRLLAAAPSLPSLDLQVLTTPFGYRRHNVPSMKSELRENLESIGGIIFDEPEPFHQTKIGVHHHEGDATSRGLIVTQKNMVGAYSHEPTDSDLIYVIEEQGYVIHASTENGFSKRIMKLLSTVSHKDEQFQEVVAFVDEYIAAHTVIPTATTVYAYRDIEQPVRVRQSYGPEIDAAYLAANGKTADGIA